MVFGMKRGFLKQVDKAESPVQRNINGAAAELRTLERPESQLQFSHTCRLHSENPYIVVADYRLLSSPCFLYLPSKNAAIVIADYLEGVQTISKWQLWEKPCPSPPLELPFVIQASGEKGLGMFARRPIARGELIMLERPVYVAHHTLEVHVDQKKAFYDASLAGLSPTAQASITSLHNAQPPTDEAGHVRGVILTNALAAKMPHTKELFPALFPHLSRANHDCSPNAHYFFCKESFTGRFHAVRSIAEGEEITIQYTDLMAPRERRQEDLRARYGFTCACATCSRSPARAGVSDAKRKAIAAYLVGMKDEKIPKGASLARVKEMLRWAEEDGLVEGAYILALSGMRLARREGDHAEVLRLTVNAMDYTRALEGNDAIGMATLASRMGLGVPALISLLDGGTTDYGIFERLLQDASK
ncbi:hypothetical protein B0H11DRAFT_2223216 [Mycena galericulata]|nr:hypothetical protein B0H11DRAFT_2223216 [Mycena galericulata]